MFLKNNEKEILPWNYDVFNYIPKGYIEISKEEFDRLDTIWKEIKEKKRLLIITDFKAIKHSEGCYTEEEYAPIKALRQSYRDRINELEQML